MRSNCAPRYQASAGGPSDPDNPIGNYLFTFPTGVGKPVAAPARSIMGSPAHRFDWLNMIAFGPGRLSARRRYVGYYQVRLLTDRSISIPFGLLRERDRASASPTWQHPATGMDNGKRPEHHARRSISATSS